jgi:drug/metabolite transporter (DMT)-like permease
MSTLGASGAVLILLGAFFWSTGGVGIKVLDGWQSPLAISAGRGLFCALFFAFLLGRDLWPSRGRMRTVALGAVSYVAVVTLFVTSNRLTTAANAILLQNSAPLWVAVLGWLALREALGWREIVALCTGIAGIVLIATGEPGGSAAELPQARLGDALSLASGLAFGVLALVLRSTAGRPDGAAVNAQVLFWGNVLAFAAGLPWMVGELGTAPIAGQHAALGWLVLAFLGVVQLGWGYYFFQRGLRSTKALTGSLLSLLEPVLNPVWVWLVVDEIPAQQTIVGGAVLLGAVALCAFTAGGDRTREW